MNATHIDFVNTDSHYEDLLMEIFRETALRWNIITRPSRAEEGSLHAPIPDVRNLAYRVEAHQALRLREKGGVRRDQPVDIPKDQAYKNIEDADFEDITGDSGKPS